MIPVGFFGPNFTGIFDGNHHQIANWTYIADGQCVGLFGNFAGQIHDLTLLAPKVASDEMVGALVGCNYAGQLVRDQVVGGSVASGGIAGGLVGVNGASSQIKAECLPRPNRPCPPTDDGFGATGIASSSSGATVAGLYSGGLVGGNAAQIVDSYATGVVSGLYVAGGLIGLASASVAGDGVYPPSSPFAPSQFVYHDTTRSYANGHVDSGGDGAGLFYCLDDPTCLTASDSFWDSTRTEQATSVVGSIGLSSQQMSQQSSFADWDFTDVWTLAPNAAPTLRSDGDVAPLANPVTIRTTTPVPYTFTVTAYDFDGDTLTYSIATPPQLGSAEVVDGNQLSYTPGSWGGFTDSFTFIATDSHGVSSAETEVLVNVTPSCNPAEPAFVDGGDGSLGNPYVITSVAELQLLHIYTVCNFVLNNDLDLNGVDFPPIGSDLFPFSGSFQGGGHVISNWSYTSSATTLSVGFFSVFNSGATVENLGLENINVVANGGYVGGLAGVTGGGGMTVDHVYTTGTVTNNAGTVGGLFGSLSGIISDSFSTATVTGTNGEAGGLIGQGIDIAVEHCYASGDVYGSAQYAGGLMGYFVFGRVEQSYASGHVSVANGGFAGGLLGFADESNGDKIVDSYAIGAVTADSTSSAGGLFGDVYAPAATVQRLFATGSVSAAPGGIVDPIVGRNEGWSGLTGVSGTDDVFWDVDTTGLASTSIFGTAAPQPKSDTAMQQQATYTDYDFVNVWNPPVSGGYPTLR